jgi:membrane associated rhomboid family serine protease
MILANVLVELGLALAIVGNLAADWFFGEDVANFVGALGVILILAAMVLQ